MPEASTSGTTFGERLRAGFDAHGQLCVGIDPHASLLADWGLRDSPDGVREFGERVVDAATGRIAVVKPQIAFFERHGSAGYAALEQVLAAARAAGLLVIADVKRGDIGSTMDGYAEAWLTPGTPLESDAITVSPYLGAASLTPTVDRAATAGKGVFVLAATSNPEAAELQRSVARGIVGAVRGWNAAVPETGLGAAGVVIGATVHMADVGIDVAELTAAPILAPGFGHQGARVEDARSLFGALTPNVLVASSRGVLSAGPDGLAGEIERQAAEARRWLR